MKVSFESSSRIATLENPAEAKFLTDEDNLQMLHPFFGENRSVSQAAKEARTSLLKMYRFVQKALTLGVLEHTHSEPRQGKAIKYYRASAGEFFVPYGETTQLSFEEIYSSSDSALRASLFKSLLHCFREAAIASGGTLGLRIFKDIQGQLNLLHALGHSQPSVMRSFLNPDAPAVWSEWALVNLELEAAKALQEQLYQTVRQASEASTGVPYLLRVALVPIS